MYKKIINSLLAAALLAGVSLFPAVALAAATSFSMVANKSTVSNGGSLIVALYMNGGGNPVNAIQLDLTYPASKLQYVGYSSSGSAFEITASNGGGDGSISIARGTTGTVSGSGLIGTVTFKGLASSGSASIGVAGSSAMVVDGNAIPYASYGTSVNFGAVATAPKAAAVAEAPKDTAAPIITLIKAKDVTPFSAAITWTTNEPGDSVVEYGLDATYGLSASSSTQQATHEVALSSAFITPKTVLHYRVKSTDGAGNVAVSPDQTLQLPGVEVTIIVRGADGKPKAGVSVTLDNQTGTTDSKGQITLHSSLGNKKITTDYQGVTVQKPITVTKSAKPLPPFQLDLAKKPLNSWMVTSIGLMIVVLTLLGIDAVLFGSRLFGRLAGLHFHPQSALAGLHFGSPFRGHTHSIHTKDTPSVPMAEKEAPDPEPLIPQQPPETSVEAPAPSEPEPELDPNKTVAELMGETTAWDTAKPEPPVEPAPKPSEPIKITLEPLNSASPEPDKAASVANRLKKPAHHPYKPKTKPSGKSKKTGSVGS